MNTDTTHGEAAKEEEVLSVTDLSVDFGVDGYWVPAAKNLTYSIKKGEVLAIVGESGSGKSASSMAILGLLPKNSRTRGSAKLSGMELVNMRPSQLRHVRGGRIAIIFQEPMTALNPVYTIGFQIIETLRVHFDMAPSAAKVRALELLTMVELPDPQKAFDSYPHQLSGGQLQRAMIAQALSCDPELLIADEPTTALDVTIQAEILELLRGLRERLNSAVLLITHDMGVVADIAENIVVMRSGEIVERGTVEEVFRDPKHPYTRALLDAVPHLGEATINTATSASTESAADERPVIVEYDDVAIEYPKHGRVAAFRAADHISLTIHEAEVVGLVGESGSGKTTLGRAAVGLLPIHSGRLVVAGHDLTAGSVSENKRLHHDVGIVFQDPASSLNPRLSIGDSIGEPLEIGAKLKGEKLRKRVDELLDAVELPRNYRDRFPHELSGGQKQRVGIARALSLSPKLLVADEPTSALDVSVQARVLTLIQDLQKEMGFACLFITHDLAVIDVLAERIVVMRHGEIVEVGTRDQILRHPKHPYTQRLIAAVPVPDPVLQQERRDLRLQLLKSGGDD